MQFSFSEKYQQAQSLFSEIFFVKKQFQFTLFIFRAKCSAIAIFALRKTGESSASHLSDVNESSKTVPAWTIWYNHFPRQP